VAFESPWPAQSDRPARSALGGARRSRLEKCPAPRAGSCGDEAVPKAADTHPEDAAIVHNGPIAHDESFDAALAGVLELAAPTGVERVRLKYAHGRRLATPIVALQGAPCTTVSAMDGYAVRDADLQTLPARLRIVGRSYAGGGFFAALEPGACVRVFTGAPTPVGADRVVVQEVVAECGNDAVFAHVPPAARHLRAAGSDFAAGETLVDHGAVLTPQALIAAAAANMGAVDVYVRPRLTVIATGDELFEPGEAVRCVTAIPESVSFGVAALGEQWGARLASRRRVGDDPAAMARVAAAALEEADIVVVIGGASVGERDFAKAMFAPLGLDLRLANVAMKPGRPVWAGRARGKLVIGLPGNPTAAMVAARLFLAPVLARMGGADAAAALRWMLARAAAAIEPCGPRETFLRGRWSREGVVSMASQDSSGQKALGDADLLIRRRPHAPPVAPGDLIEVVHL
jgi:molybdopterin molybdotransferase